MDLFDKFRLNRGALGNYAEVGHNYFMFPKLEGPIGPRMRFRGKEKIVWSINNYLGLANHPEVREVDARAAAEWGLAHPMGARMLTGNTRMHEELEAELAEFSKKEDAFLLNYGYQGVLSIIDALLSRHDIAIYDSESHACIIDGLRMHSGKRFVFKHNDIDSLEQQLRRATERLKGKQGGILVISEGVFGMAGDQGMLREIVALKEKYPFRLLVDDAHGFGVLGHDGSGTGTEQAVQDQIDIYIATFAKAMASIGAFVAGEHDMIHYLRYNTRSQIFAKSLPMPLVIGNLKRLALLRTEASLREKLWHITHRLQQGLRELGFDLGATNTPVTPVYLKCSIPEIINLVIDLRENYDVFCSVVIYPVVPKGVSLLRLIPTAAHSDEDVDITLEAFGEVQKKLTTGKYRTETVTVP